MTTAIALFALTYVLMLAFSKRRTIFALASGMVFIVSGMLPSAEILSSLDFNVLLMIAGTMGLVALFIESKMPSLLADLIMERVPNIQMAAVALALFAGVISAFVDNVATVLMVAPVAMEICHKLRTNPVPFIIYDKDTKWEIKDGAYGLANVAPTVVKMMGLTAPDCWEESMV